MWLTSLFLPMGFYLRRPSASSSLPCAKLNTSISPLEQLSLPAPASCGQPPGAGSPQEGSWQHPTAHGDGEGTHSRTGPPAQALELETEMFEMFVECYMLLLSSALQARRDIFLCLARVQAQHLAGCWARKEAAGTKSETQICPPST